MGGKVKNENVKVEKKDGSSYFIANMDLKKLDFTDNTICFIGAIRNCPCIFSIKDNSNVYGKTVYIISNDINDESIKCTSLAMIKKFIAHENIC